MSAANEVLIRETLPKRSFNLDTHEGIEAFWRSKGAVLLGDWADNPLPPVSFIIDEMIDDNSLTVFAAGSTAGKSVVMSQMAHAILAGGQFLNRACLASPVLYYEDQRTAQSPVRIMCQISDIHSQ